MTTVPRASALKLASTAHEMGAEALRGTLEQNAAGRWTVGHIEVESWLSRYAGQELVLAAAAIDQETPMVLPSLLTTGTHRIDRSPRPMTLWRMLHRSSRWASLVSIGWPAAGWR